MWTFSLSLILILLKDKWAVKCLFCTYCTPLLKLTLQFPAVSFTCATVVDVHALVYQNWSLRDPPDRFTDNPAIISPMLCPGALRNSTCGRSLLSNNTSMQTMSCAHGEGKIASVHAGGCFSLIVMFVYDAGSASRHSWL